MDASNQLPVDFEFLSPTMNWNNEVAMFVEKLVRIAVQRSDEKLLACILRKIPENRVPIDALVGAIDGHKPASFLEFIKNKLGERIKRRWLWAIVLQTTVPRIYDKIGLPKITEFAEIGFIVGCLDIVDFFVDLMGDTSTKLVVQHSAKFLFSACFNGTPFVINRALDYLKKYGKPNAIEDEMRGIYKFMRVYDITLLSLLCFQNYDSVPGVKILFENGFPDNLLLFEFFGKNSLYYAIWYENKELVEILLEKENRRQIFLSDDACYENMTASEFARSLQFDEIADLIDQFYDMMIKETASYVEHSELEPLIV
ncbi:uncharacterized protein LOC142336829 isoform X2 [Convolutriloba macropyga]|uniref:uncharacterized protein LOC142336829 isoform X2 n=1 Tax=Convolutriloba macropyga TaxID=536237 RepID=UPI003F5213FC